MQLLRETPTERMTFEDGNWVDLKARLTIAERKTLAGAAISVDVNVDGGKPSFIPRADVSGAEMAALRLGIVAWSLPDPLTPENIGLLDEDTGMVIKVRLDELWRTRTDDERKNLNGAGALPSEEKGESLASLSGSQ